METAYSTNDEDFNHDTIEEAAYDAFDGEEIGSVTTIYEGELIHYKASSFLPNLCEYMGEQAYDVCGEYAENWDFTKEQSEEMQAALAELVDNWADKHNAHPNFSRIGKSTPIIVRLKSEDGDFEILEPKPKEEI